MKRVIAASAALCLASAGLSAAAAPAPPPPAESGVLRVKSHYGLPETIARLKDDIASNKIVFFSEVDQAALASGTGLRLKPSVLLTFGNPPLGLQFLTASPYAALDWPVRMVVFQDDDGSVWVAYTDFSYIARRHRLTNRAAALKMAAEVAASIARSVT